MKQHGRNLKCILLRDQSEKAAYILSDPNYRTFWKKGKMMEVVKKLLVASDWGHGGMNRWNTGFGGH